MGNDISITFKSSDQMSKQLVVMRNNVNQLSRDVTKYKKVQDKTFNKNNKIKIDVSEAQNSLKILRDQHKKNTKAIISEYSKQDNAILDQMSALSELNRSYKLLGDTANDTRRAENRLADDIAKNSNVNATRTNLPDTELTSDIPFSDYGSMLWGSIGQLANQQAGSIFGETAGSQISSILSATIAGAGMGSMAGIGIGTVVGAGVGLVSGSMSAISTGLAKDDDIFRGTVDELYSQIVSDKAESQSSGISLASKRENNNISFSAIIGEGSEELLSSIEKLSDNTPFTEDYLLAMSKQMSSDEYDTNEIIPLMTTIGDAGINLGHSTDDMSTISNIFGSINKSNKFTQTDVDMLQTHSIPAMTYLSESIGKSQSDIYKMIADGDIDADEFLKIIENGMQKDFGGGLEQGSNTFEGLSSTLENYHQKIDRAYGEGYNTVRKQGMQEEISILEGPVGQELQAVNTLEGQLYAQLENDRQMAILEAKQQTMETDTFKIAKADGNTAEMVRLLDEAKANAITESNNSVDALEMQKQEILLLKGIQSGVTNLDKGSLDLKKDLEEQKSTGKAAHKVYESTGQFDYSQGNGPTYGNNPIQSGGYGAAISNPDFEPIAAGSKIKSDDISVGSNIVAMVSLLQDNPSANSSTNLHKAESVVIENQSEQLDKSIDALELQRQEIILLDGIQSGIANLDKGNGPTYGNNSGDSDSKIEVDVTTGTKIKRRAVRAATGLQYVPYDNFPAYLHEGERVLTKNQSHQLNNYDSTSISPVVNITINNSGNAYEITSQIVEQLKSAAASYGG